MQDPDSGRMLQKELPKAAQDVKRQVLLPPTIIKLAGYCTPFSLVTGLASCPFVVVPASASGQIDVACWLVIVASFAR